MREIGKAERFARCDDPPLLDHVLVPIIRPAQQGSYCLILLSDKITGFWIHSIDRRDTPCLGANCPHKHAGEHMPRRWKGYFPAWEPGVCRTALAEVSHGAWSQWVKNMATSSKPARGGSIWVRRLGKAANAPCSLEFRPAGDDPDQLPDAFDVTAALERIWGSANRE